MSFKEYLNENNGTYAGVRFTEESKDYLMSLIEQFEIPNPVEKDDIHCTLLYSKKYLPDYKPQGKIAESAHPLKLEIFENDTNVLVLRLDSDFLQSRHEYLMKEHDAEYSHDEYKPHITLSLDVGDLDITKLKFTPEQLEIVEEYSEDLKGD